MLRTAGFTLRSAHQSIDARSATAEEAELLVEKKGRPADHAAHDLRRHGTAGRVRHAHLPCLPAFDFQLLVRA
jgi:GntR family transcriptional regulator